MIWFYLILSYFIGCIMFGYLVTKSLYRNDIRLQGSGNVGARNAGRVHGKKAFVITFLGDAVKGAVVIALARYLHFSETIQLLGLWIAIIGHLWPVTLKFKGGKGISTFIGGIITFNPIIALVIILAFLILYPLTKSLTLGGLGAFIAIPVFLFYQHYTGWSCILAIILILTLILAQAEDIRLRLKK
jgi:glycerol-3-phosphate acyltransferase PlsY